MMDEHTIDLTISDAAINGHERPAHRELRVVAPTELYAFWPLVRDGVFKVHERASDGWLPEDIYSALKAGVSQLLVGFVEHYYVGCIVITPQPGWQGPQAHIWALYNRGERDVLETFLPDLLDMVRARGITRLTMSSPRRGWEKRAHALGFEPTQLHFAREV